MADFGLRRIGAGLRLTVVGAAALAMGLGGASVLAQDATPVEDNAVLSLIGVDGGVLGEVEVSETDGAVTFAIDVSGLEPGEHGMHLHAVGVCDPEADPPFDSASGHFNPESTMHGPGEATTVADDGSTPMAHDHGDDVESHAGDLGNIVVAEDGTATVTVTTSTVTLEPGAANSLADADGTALMIHADADDLMTDPSGNSGDRIGCAVVFGATEMGTPVATPVS